MFREKLEQIQRMNLEIKRLPQPSPEYLKAAWGADAWARKNLSWTDRLPVIDPMWLYDFVLAVMRDREPENHSFPPSPNHDEGHV